jgi:hypothetical protein
MIMHPPNILVGFLEGFPHLKEISLYIWRRTIYINIPPPPREED